MTVGRLLAALERPGLNTGGRGAGTHSGPMRDFSHHMIGFEQKTVAAISGLHSQGPGRKKRGREEASVRGENKRLGAKRASGERERKRRGRESSGGEAGHKRER